MKNYHQPSGLARGIDFLIDAGWTPDQALTVVGLLDDLRDRIWAHYELQLYEQLREEHPTTDISDDDPPF